MHTNLKQKKPDTDVKSPEAGKVRTAEGEVSAEPSKKDEKKKSKHDDISWI